MIYWYLIPERDHTNAPEAFCCSRIAPWLFGIHELVHVTPYCPPRNPLQRETKDHFMMDFDDTHDYIIWFKIRKSDGYTSSLCSDMTLVRPWHDVTCDNHVTYLSAYQYLGIRRGHHQKTTPKSGSCSPPCRGFSRWVWRLLGGRFLLGRRCLRHSLRDDRRRRFTTIGKDDDGEDDDSNDEDDNLQWCLHNIDTKS